MREILFRGKTPKGKWLYGNLLKHKSLENVYGINQLNEAGRVFPETVGQFTCMVDKHITKIFEGDIVEFLGKKGVIIFECGAFGIEFDTTIDWEKFQDKIKPYTGCDNIACVCFNDNFISLFEIYWNFNEEQNMLGLIEIIGNIYDNPELLEVEE